MSEEEKYSSDTGEIVEQNQDDSDDDVSINTVGNIPLEWYDEFEHIGYTSDGRRLYPEQRQDILQEVINRSENPNWWREYYDKREGRYKTITAEDLDMIERFKSNNVAIRGYQYNRPVEVTEYEDKIHPLKNIIKTKKAFIPSRQNLYKITRLINQIRKRKWQEEHGLLPPEKKDEAVDIWADDFEFKPLKRRGIPAPKMPLPSTDDSYHPPNDKDPKRLADVGQYNDFIKERFERSETLYLAPREVQRKKPETSAELLPELPNIDELRPYPTTEAIRFVGHKARVKCFDLSPDGSIMVSASVDGVLKFWETMTGRCIKTVDIAKLHDGNDKSISSVAYCPNPETPFVVLTSSKYAFIIRNSLQDITLPNEIEEEEVEDPDIYDNPKYKPEFIPSEENPNIIKLAFQHLGYARQVIFSRSGTFLALLAHHKMVYIFNLKRNWAFKTPITSRGTYIQKVMFHPSKPRFFVATQQAVLVFDLQTKARLMRLKPGCQWISSFDVHPRGENVIASSYDGRAYWFDLQYKPEPYKYFRGHEGATRDVSFHKRFPLFAIAYDDATINVVHCNVFSDLVTLPQLTPVKELRGHMFNDFGVLSVKWHPTQPWLLSSGADHTIRLWS